MPEADRGKWANGVGLEPYVGQEYLFLAGCVGAYDERGQKMARAVAGLLKAWGVDFGILGADEHCDGSEVRDLGEKGLFQSLAERNIRQFQELKTKKMITLSPHAYHAFKEDYAAFGGTVEVYHYSQILAKLARKAPIKPLSLSRKVAFHDPCYLGRHQKEYQAPRKLLSAIPGLQLIELERSRADALCCGGGGGNFFTEILGHGPDSPARVRVREAAAAGADILVVACPNCAKMLDDAAKTEGLEETIQVRDLAEIARPGVVKGTVGFRSRSSWKFLQGPGFIEPAFRKAESRDPTAGLVTSGRVNHSGMRVPSGNDLPPVPGRQPAPFKFCQECGRL